MTAINELVADLYATAADDIEGRRYGVGFHAGRAVWHAVHQASTNLLVAPVVEGLRRRIGERQVQFWDADQATVVATLRGLAADHEYLDVLRDAAATHQIQQACAALRDAFGVSDSEDLTLSQLADYASHRQDLLERENADLRGELAKIKAERRAS